MEQEQKQTNLGIPIAIVMAGAIVAGAIFLTGGLSGGAATNDAQVQNKQQANPTQPSLAQMRPVDKNNDHIFGNPNAPVTIVEYSDFECPYCKSFHGTMHQIMDTYGKDGKVAWVYRQFPVDSLHTKARTEALASECAAELGGNDGFWEFTDTLFDRTATNDRTDLAILPDIAEEIGLDRNEFEKCMASERHAERIQADVENAQASGGRGTPWSILVGPDGERYPINGAQPYAAVKQLIDLVLEES